MKKVFLNSLLLLCALIVGSGSLWADDQYTKVTAANQINTSDTYIIVCEGQSKAMGTFSSGNQHPNVGVTISNSSITVAAAAETKPQEVKLVSTSTNFYIAYADDATKYLNNTSSTYLKTVTPASATDKAKWSIAISNDEAHMGNVDASTRSIIYRASTNEVFGAYVNNNVNNSEYYYSVLYKKATDEAAIPKFSVEPGRTEKGTALTISTGSDCVIWYTTDGTNPETSGTAIISDNNFVNLTLNSTTEIRAIAMHSSTLDISDEASGMYYVPSIDEMTETKSSFSFSSAATVNGELESDITWTAYKGGSSTNVGNYNSAIRLYQISGSNEYGGYIKLSAPSGFTICGFKIKSTNEYATTVNYTIGDYSDSFDGDNYNLAKSSEYTILGLDLWEYNSVCIYNLGTTSSNRLEIGEITVYFTGGGSVTLSSDCKYGDTYYATYSNPHAFVVPEGISVSEVDITNQGKLSFTTYETGDVVPANNPVLISSASYGAKNLVFSGRTGSSVLGDDNKLRKGGVNKTEMETLDSPDDYYFYKLALKKDAYGDPVANTAGFYWGAEEGVGFTSGEGKAYLVAPKASLGLAPSALRLVEDESNATSIESIKDVEEGLKFIQNGQLFIKKNGTVYDVLGQMVK